MPDGTMDRRIGSEASYEYGAFHKLTKLKQEYVESVEIEKYWITNA